MTAVKTVLWLLCLIPAAQLAWRAWTGRLTANPIEFITLHTGFWALVLLLATLAVTPVRRITGWNRVIQIRRPLGLFAFFYALLHFLTYVALDLFFDFGAVAADILKRPYITVGFVAFVILIPLAATSTKGAIRRLGRNWLRLHRLLYLSAALAVLHFYWKKSAKSDVSEPLIFAGILALLLLARIAWFILRRRRAGA